MLSRTARPSSGPSSFAANDSGAHATCDPIAPHLEACGDVLALELGKEVDAVRDGSWETIYMKIHSICADVNQQRSGVSPEAQHNLEIFLRATITAFLEKLGADPRQCGNPCQGWLYEQSMRLDYIVTGVSYIEALGGKDALLAEMAVGVRWQQFLDKRDSGDKWAKAIWDSFTDVTSNLSSGDEVRLRKALVQDTEFKSDGATIEDYRQRLYELAREIGLEKQEGEPIRV